MDLLVTFYLKLATFIKCPLVRFLAAEIPIYRKPSKAVCTVAGIFYGRKYSSSNIAIAVFQTFLFHGLRGGRDEFR